MRIYLAELQAYRTGTGVVTHRFTDGQGYDNAGTFYLPRLENPAMMRRDVGSALLGGRQSASYGELTLINADGALNALADDFFDGRLLTIKVGEETDAYGAFQTLLVATIESVAFERERIQVRLQDRGATLDKAFSTVTYAGTNALPLGIEGTADDIKGQYKPRIFGRVALMNPVLVNTSKLIYQANAGAVAAFVNVYDAGAYMTRGADYTSQSDMETNQPSPGQFRCWNAGGCFRLGSTPYGQVSCSVAESWTHTSISAAGIIKRVLDEIGVTDYVMADFTALDQKCAGPLGVVVEDAETTAALLDRICSSVGAWWGFDALNRFRVGRLDTPSSPVLTITDGMIADGELERQPPDAQAVWKVVMQGDRNYAVQDKKSLAGVVPEARAAWFSAATRDQVAEDSAVKTTRLLATEQTFQSLFCGISQLTAEASRRLGMLKVRRDTVNATLPDLVSIMSQIDIGSVVRLQTTDLGYGAGRDFVVIGVGPNLKDNFIDLTLWG